MGGIVNPVCKSAGVIAVARRMQKRRTSGHARPLYHEVQPGGVAPRRQPGEDGPVREQADGFELVLWALVALIVLIMIDTYVWDGRYRHGFWVALNAQAESARTWTERLWLG